MPDVKDAESPAELASRYRARRRMYAHSFNISDLSRSPWDECIILRGFSTHHSPALPKAHRDIYMRSYYALKHIAMGVLALGPLNPP
jgi:hypothetical protein